MTNEELDMFKGLIPEVFYLDENCWVEFQNALQEAKTINRELLNNWVDNNDKLLKKWIDNEIL